jgi:hypothetical protein
LSYFLVVVWNVKETKWAEAPARNSLHQRKPGPFLAKLIIIPKFAKFFFGRLASIRWPIRILVLLASRLCYSKHLLIHTFPATADAAAAVSSQVHYLIILLLEFLKIPCSREARVRLTPLFSAERLLTQTFIPEDID